MSVPAPDALWLHFRPRHKQHLTHDCCNLRTAEESKTLEKSSHLEKLDGRTISLNWRSAENMVQKQRESLLDHNHLASYHL